MKWSLIVLSLLISIETACGQQSSREISLTRMQETGLLKGGEILPTGGPPPKSV